MSLPNPAVQGEKPKARKPLKVKTGCITCKIRKVKCDEEHPSCRRCRSTGRICDGYAAPTTLAKKPSQETSVIVPHPPQTSTQPLVSVDSALLSALGTGEERRFLDFFHRHTGPALAGAFDTSFWTHLLPQLSQSEPSIRHALLAVGSLHAHYESSQNSTQAISHPFTLQQYNQAIISLRHRILAGDNSVDLILMCCLLFICLECLRGNQESALGHLQNGLNILSSTRTEERGLQPDKVFSFGTDFINQNLSQIFSRLNAQSTMFGQPALEPSEGNLIPVVPPLFTNLFEARASIDALMTFSLRFVASVFEHKYVGTVAMPGRVRQLELQTRLQQWLFSFEAFVERARNENLLKNHREETLLRLQHKATYIWLSTCLVSYETIFDAYTEEFESIIMWAQELATIPNNPSLFTLDMVVIPPLFLTAIKCRHSCIRRKAIEQLYAATNREGLWDSKLHAKAAERIVAIEESTLAESEEIPTEASRVHNTHIKSDMAINPLRAQLTFYTKPYGLDGDWVIWEEDLVL